VQKVFAALMIQIKKISGATPRRRSSGPIPEGFVIWQICYPYGYRPYRNLK
jgi:hypothetical protein